MAERMMETSPEDVQRRLRYVSLGPEDVARCAALRVVIERNLDDLSDAFFKYLASFEETRPLFNNRKLLEEARAAKREHLLAMASGQYDVGYAQQRIRLGTLYGAAPLELRVFLGAFHNLMRAVGERIIAHFPNADVGFQHFMSFKKLAFFDIGLIVDVLVHERERLIRQQQESIRELSTPVLQLRERLLILPIIGLIDSDRARQLTENLLHSIRANRAKVVVIDVTGVAAIDSKVANHIVQTVAASKLMGAVVIITGLSADVAQTLVTVGVDLSRLNTVGDLQGGIEEAERLLGYDVVKVRDTVASTVRTT